MSYSFFVCIKQPSSVTVPYPTITAYERPSIPIPNTVAMLTYQISIVKMAMTVDKAISTTCMAAAIVFGAVMTWTRDLSRVVDTLKLTPNTKKDRKRIGVTGACNGKGAMVAGAFGDKKWACSSVRKWARLRKVLEDSDQIQKNRTKGESAHQIVNCNT